MNKEALKALTDEELNTLSTDVEDEYQRRYILATAKIIVEEQNQLWMEASGHVAGEEWVAPTGGHDAYPLGWEVILDGKRWKSLIPANVTKPGNPADPQNYRWWKDMTPPPDPVPGPAAWDGNGYAYKVGDKVTYLTKTYTVQQAHTSQPGWTPPVVPALYKEV